MLIWSIYTIQFLYYAFAALQFFYPDQPLKIILWDFISGIDHWIIAENYHIGASGLIYVFFSLFFLKAYKLNTIDL
jgi:uncharacterized membrane protein